MKIGILLPEAVDLALIRRVRELCSLIGDCRTPDGGTFSVAVGLPDTTDAVWRQHEKLFREGNPDVVVRHLKWEPVSVDNARRMFSNIPESFDLHGIEEVVVGRDWGWNFTDCDAALVFADPALGAVLPLLPTAFYCRDLAARIVPEAFAQSIHDPYWKRQTEAFRIWRQSTVFTSDPATIDDLVSYAGVRRERLFLAPNLLAGEIDGESGPAEKEPSRLLWMAEPSALHDFHHALRGLQTYLAEGGTLKPLVIGENVGGLEVGSDRTSVTALPDSLADLLYGLPKLEIASDRQLFRLLRRSGVLWSSRIAGGEGEAAILAAQAELPFVGADYPVNRAPDEAGGTVSLLYGLDDPIAIAEALHQAQALADKPHASTPNSLPVRAHRVEQVQAMLTRLLGRDLAA